MEEVMKQWSEKEEEEEEEEAEVEVQEEGLVRRQVHTQVTTIVTTSSIDIQGQVTSETYDVSSDIEKSITSLSSDPIIPGDSTSPQIFTIESEKRQEIFETKDYFSDIKKKNIASPPSDPLIPGVSTSPKNVTIESEKTQEISGTKLYFSDIEKKNFASPSSDPIIPVYSTSPKYITTESERVGIITENVQLVKELYLESLYQKPPTQGFYCPNCRACIQKVLILDTVREEPGVPAQPLPPLDRFRCSTCFSFLIPIGSWLFPGSAHGQEGSQMLQPEPIISDGASKTQDASYQAIEIPEDEPGPDGSTATPSRWGLLASALAFAIPKKPQADISKIPEQKPVEDVVRDGVSTEPPASTTRAPTITAGEVQEPGSSKTWDILKSIVYGGLVESIASLSIVASSASADAATLSIIALSLANLIGGLFILVHHIWDLKAEEQSTNEVVDRYHLSLGKRENFYLHLCIAMLSFIIFGVVPPLAYGLTFYEVNNKNVALAAVAGAAVICITLLAITKTYIQRPNTYLTYLKTVLYYLSTGALTSVISYLAGVLIRELLEKLGIGSESSSGFTLMLPEMSVIEKPRFGSY
ncbi:membrane protein of ER body 2-like isoform X2 [Prosopis cineraria]|uniref:membrane protein of ER body 2-like isoform X2 n=1 Tax=Prosopis cineraria TaxID=364024 RepID=UPI00240FC6B6|nr:membrane protein of ER body 2-like isoform X2 [Prosopis cineraria]